MQKAILPLLVLISIFSCKKDFEVVPIRTTAPSISQNALTTILAKQYIGQTIGKYQNNHNGSVQTTIINQIDTLRFVTHNDINFPNVKGLKLLIEENEYHEMLLKDSNLSEEYIVFSNGRGNLSNQPPPSNVTDRYMSSTIGPEAVLFYYYQKDSMIYFRNYTSSTGGGAPSPANRYYYVSYLK